jgi:hypothetical protein
MNVLVYCCSVGKIIVSPVSVTASTIDCVMPQATSGGEQAVGIALLDESRVISLNSLSFFYEADLIVSSLLPSTGAAGGSVQVIGSGFLPQAVCRFGTARTKSSTYTSTRISCAVPPALAGLSTTVEVSNNGAQFSDFGTIFSYTDLPHVERLVPSTAHTHGGEIVLVHGRGFSNTAELVCRFGPYGTSRGRWLSHLVLACAAVPALRKVDAQLGLYLEVSSNGVDFSADNIPFRYHGNASGLPGAGSSNSSLEELASQPSFAWIERHLSQGHPLLVTQPGKAAVDIAVGVEYHGSPPSGASLVLQGSDASGRHVRSVLSAQQLKAFKGLALRGWQKNLLYQGEREASACQVRVQVQQGLAWAAKLTVSNLVLGRRYEILAFGLDPAAFKENRLQRLLYRKEFSAISAQMQLLHEIEPDVTQGRIWRCREYT